MIGLWLASLLMNWLNEWLRVVKTGFDGKDPSIVHMASFVRIIDNVRRTCAARTIMVIGLFSTTEWIFPSCSFSTTEWIE